MKKSLIAVAVLGAFAGAASAQSSVTLFGLVDLSLNSIKNGDTTLKTLDSNQLNSNRLGFKGTEDLGGGLTAGFWLEAGMSNDTGAAGGNVGNTANPLQSLFNRRSTVSLTSSMGEIRLGRDYNPSFWNTVFFDVYGANGLGQMLNLSSTLDSGATTLARSNNSVGYFLPSGLGGVYGQAQVALQENTGGAGLPQNRYTGGRLGYAAGPVDVAVGYGVTKTASADFKLINIGASYDFGMAKVFGLWNKSEFGNLQLKTYALSVSVPLGQGEVKAGYVAADAVGTSVAGVNTDNNNAKQMSIQYIYNLSKRTSLYTGYSKIDNDGAATFSLNGAGVAGKESSGYNFGVKHSF